MKQFLNMIGTMLIILLDMLTGVLVILMILGIIIVYPNRIGKLIKIFKK